MTSPAAPNEARCREAERQLRRELEQRYPDLAGTFELRLTPARSPQNRADEPVDYVDW